MGYFSNGTEGMEYQAQYCDKCIHWPADPDKGGCHVWLLHLLHNGADDKVHEALNILIPRTADGLGNEKCTMFHPGDNTEPEFEPEQKRYTCAACGSDTAFEVVGVLVCCAPECKHQEPITPTKRSA
jgi:hypothetical protein